MWACVHTFNAQLLEVGMQQLCHSAITYTKHKYSWSKSTDEKATVGNFKPTTTHLPTRSPNKLKDLMFCFFNGVRFKEITVMYKVYIWDHAPPLPPPKKRKPAHTRSLSLSLSFPCSWPKELLLLLAHWIKCFHIWVIKCLFSLINLSDPQYVYSDKRFYANIRYTTFSLLVCHASLHNSFKIKYKIHGKAPR